jgi:hypothetical protein
MATIPRGLRSGQRLAVSARARPTELPRNLQRYADTGEALIAEPFRGSTADGRVVPRLFPIETTGVARPVQDAAEALLASLGPEQRARAVFSLDSDAWRRWSNIHPFPHAPPLPMHIDEQTATTSPYGTLIASGGFTITLWYRSTTPIARRLAALGGLEWHFKLPRPVRAGDRSRTKFTIASKRLSSKPGRGVVTTTQELLNEHGDPVLVCEGVILVATRPP